MGGGWGERWCGVGGGGVGRGCGVGVAWVWRGCGVGAAWVWRGCCVAATRRTGCCAASSIHGVCPTTISYSRQPRDHQSQPRPCPLELITSGAMYSIEPHTVKSRSSEGARLARPKSTSITAPLETKTTFSALSSRKGDMREI